MRDVGDFAEDSTIYIKFTTTDGSGAAVAPSSAFEAADLKIYKNDSATEKSTTNGVTMTSPFDAITGLHHITIDTSNDTGDAGFWVSGADYAVILDPDETVDSQTVVGIPATFSIENRVAGALGAQAKLDVNAEADTALTDYDAVVPADLPANFADLSITGTTGRVDVASVEGSDATDQIRDAILDDATRFSGANLDAAISSRSDFDETADPVELLDTGGAAGTSASELVDDVWDENIEAAHGSDATAGLLLRALGASISNRSNNATLDALLGVADAVGSDLEGNIRGTDDDDLKNLSDEIAALNDLTAAEVNAEVDTALSDIGLDHLLAAAVSGPDITDDSIIAQLVSASATADWDDFVNTTDSLQALRDHIADGSNLTEAGGTGDQLTGIPWNSAWDAEVQSEVNDALVALGLDHLMSASVTGTDVTDDSVIAQLVSKSGVADWDDFDNTTDSLQALQEDGVAIGSLSSGAITAASIASAAADKLADHAWRRTYANVRASSDGDAVTFRSPLGMLSKMVNKWTISGTTLTMHHEDDTTTFDTQEVTSDPTASPIVTLDT